MKNQLTKLYNAVSASVAATRDALAERLQSVRETASLLYNRMVENVGYGQETLKDIVEKEAEEEQQQEEKEEDIDLTPHEHERALKGAYRSFVIAGRPKTDIDSYFDQTKPYSKTLIENQLKKMGSSKIIMTLWVIWKKRTEPLIELGPEDAKNAQDLVDDTTGDIYYTKIEMPFNSLITEFFDATDINDLIERMLAYIKAQTENPKFPENGFTLDKIMHLYINFHRLALTVGGSYIELPRWIKSKKPVINPQNKDEESFKLVAIASLRHEEIKNNLERISLLRLYENQYNWIGFKFPVSIKKIDKFEKNNPGIPVNVLFSKKKSQNIYTAHRSELNVKCKKYVNLLMIVDGQKRHYTVIKNISRLLSKLNGKTKRAYHYCMNCLNDFRTESTSIMNTAAAMVTLRLRCLLKKKNG